MWKNTEAEVKHLVIDGEFLKMYFLWLTFLPHLFFFFANVGIALSEFWILPTFAFLE